MPSCELISMTEKRVGNEKEKETGPYATVQVKPLRESVRQRERAKERERERARARERERASERECVFGVLTLYI